MPFISSTHTRRLAKVLRPLSRSEANQAVNASIHYLQPELERNGTSRFRVLGAELTLTRPQNRKSISSRQIEVFVIDYLNRRHMRVVLENRRVVEVRPLDYQPAIGSDEIAEAIKLATAVPELKKLVAQKGVFVSPYAAGKREPGERRTGLYYLTVDRDGLTRVLASTEVDLVEQRVLAVRLPGRGSMTFFEGGAHGELR